MLVNVTVQDGVAELRGTVLDERERQALRVAAENVSGVAGIKDHRAFAEPYVLSCEHARNRSVQ
jgi:osmotically-inducible protein OsmY